MRGFVRFLGGGGGGHMRRGSGQNPCRGCPAVVPYIALCSPARSHELSPPTSIILAFLPPCSLYLTRYLIAAITSAGGSHLSSICGEGRVGCRSDGADGGESRESGGGRLYEGYSGSVPIRTEVGLVALAPRLHTTISADIVLGCWDAAWTAGNRNVGQTCG